MVTREAVSRPSRWLMHSHCKAEPRLHVTIKPKTPPHPDANTKLQRTTSHDGQSKDRIVGQRWTDRNVCASRMSQPSLNVHGCESGRVPAAQKTVSSRNGYKSIVVIRARAAATNSLSIFRHLRANSQTSFQVHLLRFAPSLHPSSESPCRPPFCLCSLSSLASHWRRR